MNKEWTMIIDFVSVSIED